MILDTNALSDLLEGNPALEAAMDNLGGNLVLSPVVLGEFRFGLLRSSRRLERELILEEMESSFEVIPITAKTSRIYGILRDDLRSKGRPIPANDLWIASQALEHGLPLLTRDDHFLEVAGLNLVTW
jgi:tRNA(fMet)-specific endonuclease VapC